MIWLTFDFFLCGEGVLKRTAGVGKNNSDYHLFSAMSEWPVGRLWCSTPHCTMGIFGTL